MSEGVSAAAGPHSVQHHPNQPLHGIVAFSRTELGECNPDSVILGPPPGQLCPPRRGHQFRGPTSFSLGGFSWTPGSPLGTRIGGTSGGAESQGPRSCSQPANWRGLLVGVSGRHRPPGGVFRHTLTVLALSLPPIAPSAAPTAQPSTAGGPAPRSASEAEHPCGGARGGAAVFFGDGGGWSLTCYPVGPMGLPHRPIRPPVRRPIGSPCRGL